MSNSNNHQFVQHLIIPNEKVPAAAYQAIYHKLTSKVEKLTEFFTDAYEITVNDIIQLDNKLQQVVRQYPVQSKKSICSIAFRKDETIESSSIEKFRVINFDTPKPTSNVNYEFDFFTILPVEIQEAENITQRFKVVVLIDQDFIEDESSIPLFVRGLASGNNIRLQIDYSDFVVGRVLQVTVQDWVKTLPARKIPKFIRFIEKRADFMTAFTPYAFTAASLFGLSRISYSSSVENVAPQVLTSLSIASVMWIVGRFLNVQLLRQVEEGKPLTFIKITAGDNTRCLAMKASTSRKLWFASFIGITIVVGIAVNIFSSLIFEWAKV